MELLSSTCKPRIKEVSSNTYYLYKGDTSLFVVKYRKDSIFSNTGIASIYPIVAGIDARYTTKEYLYSYKVTDYNSFINTLVKSLIATTDKGDILIVPIDGKRYYFTILKDTNLATAEVVTDYLEFKLVGAIKVDRLSLLDKIVL